MRALLTFTAVIALAAGCGKKESTSGGGGGPAPGPDEHSQGPGPLPKRDPKTGGIPLNQFPYDPTKPEVKIDLAKFKSFFPAKDPAAAEWKAKAGKLAEVRGVMGHLSAGLKSRRETYLVKDEFTGNSIACESLFPPDWTKVAPGKSVTVVGLLDAEQRKGGDLSVRLKDAHVMAHGNTVTVPEVTAEQLGKEYAANSSAFDKKWKVTGRYYYVTGTLQRIDALPLSGGGVANKFRVGAGKTTLYCHIQNERGVKADPPKPGDKVRLLVECQGYDGGFQGISMSGVYVGKE